MYRSFLGQQSTEEGFVTAESPLSQSASASFCSEQFPGIPAQISVRVEPTKQTDEDVSYLFSLALFKGLKISSALG